MSPSNATRRQFLQSTATALAAVSIGGAANVLLSAAEAPKAARPLRLGAPVFNPPEDPEQLALAHRKLGLAQPIALAST